MTPLGAIFTVTGGAPGLSGDGGLAKGAQLRLPNAITAAPGGGFAVADTVNDRVRRVSDVGAVPGAVVHRSQNIEPGNGTVLVQPAGALAARPLREEDLIPLGSRIDAGAGAVNLAVATSAGGALAPAQLYSGAFRTVQDVGANPVTEFQLVGAIPGCSRRPPRGGVARASIRAAGPLAATARKRKPQRRLWANAHGRFRTRGRYVSALVRGTRWQTIDECNSSTVKVARGVVEVRDLVRRRTVRVRAGKSYTAPGPLPKRRR